jgi:hypothetical protein
MPDWSQLDQTMQGLSGTLMQLGMMKQMGLLPGKGKKIKGAGDTDTGEAPAPAPETSDSVANMIRSHYGIDGAGGGGMGILQQPPGTPMSLYPGGQEFVPVGNGMPSANNPNQMPFFGPGSSEPGGMMPQDMARLLMQQQLMKQFGLGGMGGGQGIIQPSDPRQPVMY